jgi:hypothetical protein
MHMNAPPESKAAAPAGTGNGGNEDESKSAPLSYDEAPASATGTIIGRIPKNARETILVSLDKFKGVDLLDVRVFFEDDGDLKPTRKGIALKVEKLPELIEVLTKALAQARRQGLGKGRPS